jgi:hypothetical protein
MINDNEAKARADKRYAEILQAQNAWRERKHKEALEKSPWIRETTDAWRDLTPEQQAELMEKAGNRLWSR